MRRHSMTLAQAGTVALRVMAWLTAQDHADAFLRVTGLDPSDLRARIQEPELQASILAYLLSQESLAAEFCEVESVPAFDIHAAHQVLGDAS